MRTWLIISTPLLLASSEPPSHSMPDVNEAGRVLATLTDSQAALYALMFIIVVLLAERAVGMWQARATSKSMATAIDRLATAVTVHDTDINVNLALIRHGVENIRAGIK